MAQEVIKIRGGQATWKRNRIRRWIYTTAQVKIKKQDKEKNTTLVEITISEGRNRQVRRMFEYFGHQVNKLTRIQFGPIDLKGLNAGEGRVLTPHEVKILRHLAENGK